MHAFVLLHFLLHHRKYKNTKNIEKEIPLKLCLEEKLWKAKA
jgi:hypothetical protein